MEQHRRIPEENERERELSGERRGAEELLGEPRIPAGLYRCSKHGDILAQDVVWRRDGRPHCPHCDALLTRAE